MKDCHICHASWAAHAQGCRVPADLARMRRVYDRLTAEDRDATLRDRIGRYLQEFGTLRCQAAEGLPRTADCAACGYADICVIRPG